VAGYELDRKYARVLILKRGPAQFFLDIFSRQRCPDGDSSLYAPVISNRL